MTLTHRLLGVALAAAPVLACTAVAEDSAPPSNSSPVTACAEVEDEPYTTGEVGYGSGEVLTPAPGTTLRPMTEGCRKTTKDAALDCVEAALGLKGSKLASALACLSLSSGVDKGTCLRTISEALGGQAFPIWRIYIATVSCGIILPAHSLANTLDYWTTNPCEEKAPAPGSTSQFSCMSVADSKEGLCGAIKAKRVEMAGASLGDKTKFCEDECRLIYNGCFNPISSPNQGHKFECFPSCVSYCKAVLLQLEPDGDRTPGAKHMCDEWSVKW